MCRVWREGITPVIGRFKSTAQEGEFAGNPVFRKFAFREYWDPISA
jgi:hypothetical protein